MSHCVDRPFSKNLTPPRSDVQFWISGYEKRHGFVTFETPRDASNCLRLASHSEPVLHVKCINPGSISRYERPKSDNLALSLDCELPEPARALSNPVYPMTPISPSTGDIPLVHVKQDFKDTNDASDTELAQQIANLRRTLHIHQEASTISLRIVSEDKERYKEERNALSEELRMMKKEVDHYRQKSEALADDLADEEDSHRRALKELETELRLASEQASQLKNEFDQRSQLLDQRGLELEESRHKLQAVERIMRSIGPQVSMQLSRAVTSSKEGDRRAQRSVASTDPFLSVPFNYKPPKPVLSALETAFIYLGEIAAAGIMECGNAVEKEKITQPNKRQRCNI